MRVSTERGITTAMAAGSIIGATLGGLAVAYAPVAFLKVLLEMRVAGCGRQDRVCRSDFKLSIGAFCCAAHMVENGTSRTSDRKYLRPRIPKVLGFDERWQGRSRLPASLALATLHTI